MLCRPVKFSLELLGVFCQRTITGINIGRKSRIAFVFEKQDMSHSSERTNDRPCVLEGITIKDTHDKYKRLLQEETKS